MKLSINNFSFHELIHDHNPYCLYCNSKCSSSYMRGTPNYVIVNYNCVNCNNHFDIHYSEYNDLGKYSRKARAFNFTCDELQATIYYETENMSLGLRNKYYLNRIWNNEIDNFIIDFSDKQKLYNKLKTYLVFS